MPKSHGRKKVVKTDAQIDLLRPIERAAAAFKAGHPESSSWITAARVTFDGGTLREDSMDAVRPELSKEDLATLYSVNFSSFRSADEGIEIWAWNHETTREFEIKVNSLEEHFMWGWLTKLEREIEADIKEQTTPIYPPPPPPPPSVPVHASADVAPAPASTDLLHKWWVLYIVLPLVVTVVGTVIAAVIIAEFA
ncbi:hypothetical protein [Nocardioides antri]|uniref:Uncharacterized protein n=1 Tax=Nocardioides antri TaxID=2607659 RepID=A0A5B1LTU2_9ACTN|nr:hypothetical protein [Nocardioides antri]KAA1424305.1 hypothetical protein F0U47_18910 [Nocardioides antri]